VNAPRSTSTSRRQLGIHRAVAIRRPPAALERKAASTIATPAKPSSMVGKVTAGSMEEPVRRAMMHAALALLAESLWAMTEPAEPLPTMILSYTLFMLGSQRTSATTAVADARLHKMLADVSDGSEAEKAGCEHMFSPSKADIVS